MYFNICLFFTGEDTGAPAPLPVSRRGDSMDLDSNIDQNRDFYKNQDVRPPYTYAALIRQVCFVAVVPYEYQF